MILICGIPNAGKTTYSAQIKNVVHYDDLPLTTRQRYERIIELAQHGEVCIDGVYGERWRRVELLRACKGQKNVCIWVDTPVEVCMSRGRETLVKMYAKHFEPPTLDEGWDEIIIKRG